MVGLPLSRMGGQLGGWPAKGDPLPASTESRPSVSRRNARVTSALSVNKLACSPMVGSLGEQDSLNLRWSNKPGRFCLGATAPKILWIPALPKR